MALGSSYAVAQAETRDSGVVLHTTTREVILDVFALDARNHPVLDLGPDDFEVFEKAGHKQTLVSGVTSLHLYDPDVPQESSKNATGFMGAHSVSCLDRTTPHYILAYRPSNKAWTSGFHDVVVKTRRHGVSVFYRHGYYVGLKEPSLRLKTASNQQVDQELWRAACNHPSVSPSISLRAVAVATGRRDSMTYSVNIDPDSLAFISLEGDERRVQLDYGACNFDALGMPLNFVKASTDQILSSVDYARVREHGFRKLFQIDVPGRLAMTRFVVRDRATGNVGSVNVIDPEFADKPQAEAAEDVPLSEARHVPIPQTADGRRSPGPGPKGSFGSIVPKTNALCADVYELEGARNLPEFRELDPVGTIYANYLLVPYQQSPPACSIPGVTCNATFGVDYHGMFWVRTPGRYDFEVTSDDGARLQIDDSQIINIDGVHDAIAMSGHIALAAGRHALHILYFEDGLGAMTLTFWVRPPDRDWMVFDMHDFPPPPSASAAGARDVLP